jgi:biopolymer transport protein ExbD
MLRSPSSVAVLLATSALLGACYMPPPVTHAALAVSADGHYTLDNQAVAAPELAEALAHKRAAAANLRIDLRASPQARMPDIEFAVAAARQAQVKLDFTHDTPTVEVAPK